MVTGGKRKNKKGSHTRARRPRTAGVWKTPEPLPCSQPRRAVGRGILGSGDPALGGLHSPGTQGAAPTRTGRARCSVLPAFAAAFPQSRSPGSPLRRAGLLPPGCAARRLLARGISAVQLSGTWPCFRVGAVWQNPSKASPSWRGEAPGLPARLPAGRAARAEGWWPRRRQRCCCAPSHEG